MIIKSKNCATQWVIDKLFKMITDEFGQPKDYIKPYLENITFANYIDEYGAEQPGKFTKDFIRLKVEEDGFHFSLEYLEKVTETIKYQKPITKKETRRTQIRPAEIDGKGEEAKEAVYETEEIEEFTGKYEEVTQEVTKEVPKYKRLSKLMPQEEVEQFEFEYAKYANPNDLKIAYIEANTLFIKNGIELIFDPRAPDWQRLLDLIKSCQGSISKFQNAKTKEEQNESLIKKTFTLEKEGVRTSLSMVAYLWEYALEEILLILEQQELEYLNYLQKIQDAKTIDDIPFDFNFTCKDGIRLNITEIYQYILTNGVERGADGKPTYKSFRDKRSRFVKDEVIETDFAFPVEVVELVGKVAGESEAFLQITDDLIHKKQAEVQSILQNSFIS